MLRWQCSNAFSAVFVFFMSLLWKKQQRERERKTTYITSIILNIAIFFFFLCFVHSRHAFRCSFFSLCFIPLHDCVCRSFFSSHSVAVSIKYDLIHSTHRNNNKNTNIGVEVEKIILTLTASSFLSVPMLTEMEAFCYAFQVHCIMFAGSYG